MITKYSQQATVATETIMEGKAHISSWSETIKLHELRIKEIETLKSRTTVTETDKVKWEKEESELKEKIVTQKKLIETETVKVTETEKESATLISTIKTYGEHIKKIESVTEILESKVKETKNALKPAKKPTGDKKDEKEEKKKEEEKDEDGDDKISDDSTEDVIVSNVAGQN